MPVQSTVPPTAVGALQSGRGGASLLRHSAPPHGAHVCSWRPHLRAHRTSAIAGVVRDTSDALLPGVTVDASCCRCWKLDLESIEHVWQRLVGDSVWREQGLPTSHDGKRPFRQQSRCAGISTFTAVDD